MSFYLCSWTCYVSFYSFYNLEVIGLDGCGCWWCKNFIVTITNSLVRNHCHLRRSTATQSDSNGLLEIIAPAWNSSASPDCRAGTLTEPVSVWVACNCTFRFLESKWDQAICKYRSFLIIPNFFGYQGV